MNDQLEQAKKRVLAEIDSSHGRLSDGRFDSIFKFKRGSNTVFFTPIWFMCANSDKYHAFHIHAAQALMLEGKIDHKEGNYIIAKD
jgi:hypothetical protein